MKITRLMNKYRECARSIWNLYLMEHAALSRTKWDIKDEYDKICSILFSTIVLCSINKGSEKKAYPYQLCPEPLPFIRIQPISQMPIKINREIKPVGYWDHPITIISPDEIDLQFIDFFDFDTLGFRDFEYYRVRIINSSNHSDILNRDALVKVNLSEAVFESDYS